MIFLKSPVFFWSPCKISCLGKVRFIQNWGLIDPDWRVFCDFWPFWMIHSSKSTCVSKKIFWTLKEILEDYLPWKNQPQSLSGSWNKAASVFTLFEWSKMDFGQYLQFGACNWSDIAYDASTRCFSQFGNIIKGYLLNQLRIISIIMR